MVTDGGVESPPRMSLGQWARANRRVVRADVESHIHAGLRSRPRWKSWARWFEAKLAELRAAADETLRDYESALERGDVLPPVEETPAERLRRKAEGVGPAAEAAKRLLAKKSVR